MWIRAQNKGGIQTAAIFLSHAKPAGGIGLRVEINQKHADAALCQARGQIDGRGGFANSAFLIGDRNYPHMKPLVHDIEREQ